MTDPAPFRTLDIQLEVDIDKPAKVVWQSLTAGIGEWWPKAFYVGTAPSGSPSSHRSAVVCSRIGAEGKGGCSAS